MAEQTPERLSLLEQARRAGRNAYAPASGLRVGAVIVAGDGRIFTGGENIENASTGFPSARNGWPFSRRSAKASASSSSWRSCCPMFSVPGQKLDMVIGKINLAEEAGAVG